MAGKRPVLLLAAACLAASIAVGSAPDTVGAGSPLVLAFYYAWYDMNTWNADRLPDMPAQLYVSADSATIERHVSQAQAAGIDAFVQSWYGPGGGNQTESNFTTLLNIAAARGFRAAVDFEAGSPYFASPADRVAALQHLLAVHAQHPAYLRVDGKPVVFFWASWLLSTDEWVAIRSQVDPAHDSVWIAEGTSAEYLAVFDGLHLYNVAWSADPGATLACWGGQVRAKASAAGSNKYWVATVMPGWDDTRIPGRTDAYVRDRGGGAFYQQCWSGAAASSPDMVVITSFNEWMEGSAIETSASSGDFYLNLTAQLASGYKAGALPVASPPPAPAPTADQRPTDSGTWSGRAESPVTAAPAATPRPTATARPDGTVVHVVEPGDTLYGIASRYGVSLESLLALNPLDVNQILSIGQTIVVSRSVTAVPVEPSSPTATTTSRPSPTASARPPLMASAAAVDSAERKAETAPAIIAAQPATATPTLTAATPRASVTAQPGQAAGLEPATGWIWLAVALLAAAGALWVVKTRRRA